MMTHLGLTPTYSLNIRCRVRLPHAHPLNNFIDFGDRTVADDQLHDTVDSLDGPVCWHPLADERVGDLHSAPRVLDRQDLLDQRVTIPSEDLGDREGAIRHCRDRGPQERSEAPGRNLMPNPRPLPSSNQVNLPVITP